MASSHSNATPTDGNEHRPRRRFDQRRLTRRRALRALAGAPLVLAAACQRGNAEVEATGTANQPVVLPPTPARSATARATSSPAVVTPVPSVPAPTTTPTPPAQILNRGGFLSEPKSHDFNADLFCGGDPSLWSGLLTLNTDLTPMADWAANWEPNADASRWTFHLRENNHGWSNSQPVTAHDFVWSWQRLLDPATKAPHAWLLFDVLNAEQIHNGELPPDQLGVKATSDWSLEVELVGPRVYFPAIVATVGTAPAYRPAVESHGPEWTEPGTIVSNGPFTLNDWQHGKQWTTSRNARHWNAGRVKLIETVVPLTPSDAHAQPYFDFDVDFLPVQAGDLATVRSISDIGGTLTGSVDPTVWFLIVSPHIPPFDTLRVRQATAHCIDRSRLEQLSEGRAKAARSLLPSTFPGRVADGDVRGLQDFDVDKALELLADTPYAGGNNWPDVSLLISDSSEVATLLANDCAAQLNENIGLKIDVTIVSPAEYDAALKDNTAGLYWKRWDFTYADPNNGYADAFFPLGRNGSLLPAPPANLGELVGRGKVERDDALRAAIYREAEVALQTSVSYIPIAYPITFYLVRPWVAGFPLASDSSLLQPGTLFTRLTSLVNIQNRPQS